MLQKVFSCVSTLPLVIASATTAAAAAAANY